MHTRFSRQTLCFGIASLLLLTAVTVLSFAPGVLSAVGGSQTEFVVQAPTDSVLRVSFATNDIVYNQNDGMIYASRPSTAGNEGNSITRINPLTGEVVASVYVGSEPNQLAISDNGQTIYVALDGALAIRKYDVSTQLPGMQFALASAQLPSPQFSGASVSDLAVLPGDENKLAVARGGGTGLAIFSNGMRLPQTGTGSSNSSYFIAVASQSRIYGGSIYEGMRTYNVSENGVTDVTTTPTSYAVYGIKYQGGKLFTSTGKVIDEQSRSLLGTCSLDAETLAFVPDTPTNRVLYAYRSGSSVVIKACDLSTFVTIGSLTIPNVGSDFGAETLLRYGSNGLALTTSNDRTYLIQTSLLPTEAPLPTPTGTPSESPTPTPPVHSTYIRSVNIANKDLILRKSQQKFYVSVPATAGVPLANTLTRIDPVTGSIENSVAVGSNPGRLALSEDGATMYLGLDGENAIRKYDMLTDTPGPQFTLGTGSNGLKRAFDIAILPGSSSSIAVSYGNSSYSYDGADIFDDGVKRPAHANPSGLLKLRSANTLFVGSGGQIYNFSIAPTGLIYSGTAFNMGSSDEYEIVGDRVYASDGSVINLTNYEHVGRYSGVGVRPGITVDVPNNRVIFLVENPPHDTPRWSIKVFQLDNFRPLGTIPLPGVAISTTYPESPHRLIRWGENGLAFNDYNGKIYFLQSDLISADGIVPTGLRLSAQERDGDEGRGSFSVTVERTGSLAGTSTVDFSTVNGTAIAGTDYTATIGTLTFAPGETSKTISIPVIDDNVYEEGEIRGFSLVLSNPSGGNIEIQGPTTVAFTISDNDGQPSISTSSIVVNEPAGPGPSEGVFTVRLSNATRQTVSVNYATANGTATAGSDYIAASGALTFAPLETTKTVSVQVLADEVYLEPTETFSLNFTNAVNAGINNFSNVANIINYNPYPIPTITPTPTPPPTPTPVPTPTPTPSPTPTPTPTATPTPTPTPTLTPTPTPLPTPVFVRRVSVPLNDFVYSHAANAVYASLPSSAGNVRGNSLTKIDPTTGEVGASVFVGSEPNRTIISDDGNTIYVKLDGAKSIRRFDVPTETAGIRFFLLGQFLYLEDWAIQPGNPQVLAVSSFDGVAIYENGVQRPVIADGGAYSINTITFSGPTTLFGWDDYTSGADLVRFTLTDSGVDGVRVRAGVQGLGDEIEYSNGLLYGSYGRVVDLGGTVVGTFQDGGGLMAVDTAAGRVFFLNGTTLSAYNINTFAKIGAVTVPGLSGATGKLVRWGENGLAVRGTNQLYLIQSPLISANGSLPTGLQLASQTYSRTESGSFTVTVTRNGDFSSASTIDYATVDGTAIAGSDYTPATGTLTFLPGELSKIINIPVTNDNVFEGNETFGFVLSNPGGPGQVELLNPSSAVLTITDNDSTPTVTAQNLSISEPRIAGVTTALFTVRLSNPTTQAASVNYTTVDVTATAGSDYTATSGTLTFAPLETTKTVQVEILADQNYNEPVETFRFSLSNAVNAFVSSSQITASIVNFNPQTIRHVGFDYDGDGRADLSVRRPSDNVWHLLRATAGYTAQQYGEEGDRMVPADYDGDGKADVAVFRPASGTWFISMSASQTFQALGWGQDGDMPVPTDRDNDGKTDLVIFRPSNNTWYTRFSNGTFNVFTFGEAGDKPMLGDFDGDGLGDVALFRPSNNNWYIIKSSLGFFVQTWGQPGDIPTTGDFDGDRKTDLAVFRPSTGEWYLSQTTAGFTIRSWGQDGDIPIVADYDGDGKTDMAVFRPSNSTWYIINTTAAILVQQFGETGDVPTQAAYLY